MLAPRGTKTVYQTCSAKKEQITTLVAVSCSGGIIPSFYIFPGKGSITTLWKVEWMVHISASHQIGGLLLNCFMDGWLIILHLTWGLVNQLGFQLIGTQLTLICKFFKENSYCHPSHSSHVTQLLDIGVLSH